MILLTTRVDQKVPSLLMNLQYLKLQLHRLEVTTLDFYLHYRSFTSKSIAAL